MIELSVKPVFMFEKRRLSDFIHDQIVLKPVSTGWEICKCPLCNDYKERGGFKFEDDLVIYSCFNCGVKSVYEEFSGKLSSKIRDVLIQLGADEDELRGLIREIRFLGLQKQESDEEKTISLATLTKVNTTTPTIKLPEKSFPLGHPQFEEYQEKLIKYLVDRKVNLDKYQFFFSLEDRFINRVIIPFYRNGNLIYWQARSVLPNEKKRYDNSPANREAVMFNMDEIRKYSSLPLFVTEGVFDAMMLNGVALLGTSLNEAKIKLLSESPRRLVFVIDKDKVGQSIAKSLIEKDLIKKWSVTFPSRDVEDVNAGVQRYGLLYTIHNLVQNITNNPDILRMKMGVAKTEVGEGYERTRHNNDGRSYVRAN